MDDEPPNGIANATPELAEPQPLAPEFMAPPPATTASVVTGADVENDVPEHWITTYRQVERRTGECPTQQTLGEVLGVKRSWASKIRTRVEECLEELKGSSAHSWINDAGQQDGEGYCQCPSIR